MKQRMIADPPLSSRRWLPNALARGIADIQWMLLNSRPGNAPRILFLLSHQRSGSSLLVHCLNTNPSVIGYGETLVHYASARDFRRLPFMIAKRLRRATLSQRYFLDKLLYDELLEERALLHSPRVRAIFLAREAEGALASLIRAPKLEGWPQRPEANAQHVDQESCAHYYTARLATLEDYARAMDDRRRALFITYGDLVDHTESVFVGLENLLEVEGGFSDRYRAMPTTGKPGLGDVSENIKAGRILRSIARPATEIRADLLADAANAFERCRSTLGRYCGGIGPA